MQAKQPAATPRKRAAAKRSTSGAAGARRAPTALAARSARLPEEVEAPSDIGRARLTSGDRVLYPADGYTKEDVFEYYREVAPLMLPVLADRPISVQQWPAGIQAPGFFKHELTGKPDWVPTLRVKHLNRTIDHVNVKSPEALLWLANQSALTLHMWSSHAPTLEIFNTAQGAQFTAIEWVAVLLAHEVKVSMDGKGQWMDNVFVERLWRSLKYKAVYPRAYADVHEAWAGISRWLHFYNYQRPHQALGYQTPMHVYRTGQVALAA
jgi:hypothetical protein